MTNKYEIEECDIYNINKKGWFLKGYSRAGLKTGFMLYPFKILLDAGIHTEHKPEFLFLTHCHIDHMQAIAHICTRHKKTKTNIYLPEQSIKYITKYFRAICELSYPPNENLTDNEILVHKDVALIKAIPNDKIDIIVNKTEIRVEVLKAYHDIESNGYGFNSWKNKIKPEYEHIINNTDTKVKISKIKELKLNNIEMYDRILINEFVFFCDSTIHNLLNHDEWKKYPIIICECTGLEIPSSRDYDINHTSLLTLKPIMLDNKDKKWMIIHVSLSISIEKIKDIETELIKEGIDVTICI